jgi:hypothetical protein
MMGIEGGFSISPSLDLVASRGEISKSFGGALSRTFGCGARAEKDRQCNYAGFNQNNRSRMYLREVNSSLGYNAQLEICLKFTQESNAIKT